ncbi:alpha/beta family hydrolase [Reyranella humidisoli]|uniref:alpha/beta family hydrolase n=1 Tax=Reyranella humidisoli TaxID=2849149 RepID=UPI0034E2F684
MGFPRHPPEKPSVEGTAHLFDVWISQLLLQGNSDALAQPRLLRSVINLIGKRATYRPAQNPDRSFGVRVRSGAEPLRKFSPESRTSWPSG